MSDTVCLCVFMGICEREVCFPPGRLNLGITCGKKNSTFLLLIRRELSLYFGRNNLQRKTAGVSYNRVS